MTGWHEDTGIHYLHNTNRHWYVYNVATSGYTDNNAYANRPTSNWGTSDRVEMSAARNFDIVQSYFLQVQGRDSFDDAGRYARANIHEGVNYVNAYWDGAAEVKVYRDVIRDFADPDEMGNALRLIGGDKLTLVATGETAAVAGGAITVDLTVWGLSGKRLVE